MKKIKMSDILLTVCAIAIVCGIGSLTLRGKKTTEKLIIGDWYQQWSDSLTFQFMMTERLMFLIPMVLENGL